ncbi:MAG TPA: hypothetical protein VM935_11975 [Chitinophagaceae bacterium]|nr:hypothetical protein [Chitinophagaceae bacterium]
MKKYIVPLMLVLVAFVIGFVPANEWQSKYVRQAKDGSLQYTADEKGNIIPDFSRVGYYHGDKEIPSVAVIKTITPSAGAEQDIQSAIDEVSKKPLGKDGFRGAILLKKGTYTINGQISIQESGIVLRGEGDDTKLIAAGTTKRALIKVTGKGNIKEVEGTRTKITDSYVPVGTFSFNVADGSGFKKGDKIIVFRQGTKEWIHDLKMDQIVERNGTKQWQAAEYDFRFEREITKVEGNRLFIDNPIVMPIEAKYGGGEIFKYNFNGRIAHVGVEHMYFQSEYLSDTAENHGWDAVSFDRIENGWVRNVTAKYFGYSCVNLSGGAKNISVLNSNCFEHKSVITGSRRYSFNNDGQQNLFMNCHTTDGRHDYVTGAKVHGPNVFVNCTAKRTHADIGPHHRWAMGTLYDNIVTDGQINVQDRGQMGSGHGWSGITQVLWNCTVKSAAVQSPYGVSGNNYCIGMKGKKVAGHFADRPEAIWEGLNQDGLQPKSLYEAQLKARKKAGL